MAFDYATTFSRNIGWLTEEEQERLRHKRVRRTQDDCGPAHLDQVITVLCDDRTAPRSIHAQVEALIGIHVERTIRGGDHRTYVAILPSHG